MKQFVRADAGTIVQLRLSPATLLEPSTGQWEAGERRSRGQDTSPTDASRRAADRNRVPPATALAAGRGLRRTWMSRDRLRVFRQMPAERLMDGTKSLRRQRPVRFNDEVQQRRRLAGLSIDPVSVEARLTAKTRTSS